MRSGGGGFAEGGCEGEAEGGLGGAADAAEVVEEEFTEGVADEEEDADGGGGLEGERGLGGDGDGPAGEEFDEGDGGEFGEGGLHHDEVALGADVAGEEDEGDEDHRQQAGGKRHGLRQARQVQGQQGGIAGESAGGGGDEELGFAARPWGSDSRRGGRGVRGSGTALSW